MTDMFSDLDGPLSPAYIRLPPTYDFNGHVVTITMPSGRGEPGPVPTFECKEAEKENSPCQPEQCMMKEIYDQVGWDIFSTTGEIELAKLSARIDWSESDEPWVEVKQ